MQLVSKHRLGKHVPAETNTRVTIEAGCFRCAPHWEVILKTIKLISSVVRWKPACEEKTRRLVWNGRQPETQLVEGWIFSGILYGRLRRKDLCVMSGVCNSVRLLWFLCLIRCQETANGDCSRLRKLVCVYQWSVKCSSEWCIYLSM
jgi:hypothetical protein